ncbi:hypothetical protein EDB92DRAFT_1902533 [Lactarius akahatsu]|uniref:Lipid droplet-associated perilipin protein n=1 Tax=Lactarius akahatsu TaxID=416441 RepID=A0AAD4L4F0_9AGAM|nr:hypothetical protein EDB92DRAFT_1902533 [Lactarius akahatsu]
MATETQSAPAAPIDTPATPELTVLNRVASIPLVNDSLSAVHSSLISNPLTRSPYNTAQALSSTALRYSEPITSKLAPIIVRADGFANKGLDAVESRYPYPFTVQSEDIINALKERSDSARAVANKTLDERVRTPAYSAAQGIDQRLTPVLDFLVSRLGTTQEGASQTESQYQYQRAYALSRDLKDQIFGYSNTQLQELQNSSVLVPLANVPLKPPKNIQNLASSGVVAAQAKVSTLSETMVTELQKVQAATAALPTNLQASFKPVQEKISGTISELSGIIKSDVPVNEKVTKVRATVQDSVTPVLETAAARLQDAIRNLTARADAVKEGEAAPSAENGDNTSH